MPKQRAIRQLQVRRALAKVAGARLRKRPVPRQREAAAARLEYQALLTTMRRALAELIRGLPLAELVDQGDRERGGLRTDAFLDDITRAFSGLRIKFAALFPPAGVQETLGKVAGKVDTKSAEEFQRQVKAALGVEIIVPEPWRQATLDTFIGQNLDLITSLTDGALDSAKGIITSGVRGGLRVEDIAQQLENQLDVTKGKAALLARDQTLKLAGEMTELRQRNVGVEEYDWDTSDDERVRLAHQALEGTRQRWDKPPIVDPRTGRRAHPGGDYQCRCQAIPVFPEELADEG